MRLRVPWGLETVHQFPLDALPVTVELGEARAHISYDTANERIELTVDVPVDPNGLRLETVTGIRSHPEGDELPAIEVPELFVAGVVARQVADAIAFIERLPLTLTGRSSGLELVAENGEDKELLKRLGTENVLVRLHASGRRADQALRSRATSRIASFSSRFCILRFMRGPRRHCLPSTPRPSRA